jgi:hypothetical protein
MLQFSIPITLPSGKIVRVPELPNKLYLSLIKYCENRDLEGVNNFFLQFLNIPADLDILDRLYLLVTYRIIFISDSIIFTSNDGKNLTFNLDIILGKIEDFSKGYDEIIVEDGITIQVGLPTTLFYGDEHNRVGDVIKSIQIKDIIIDFKNLSKEERDNILKKIPLKVVIKVQDYIDRITKCTSNMILIDSNEEFNIHQYSVDLLSNSTMLFVCSLYSHNLIDYFETLYGYVTKISADPEFYNNLSPVETRIVLNIHNKEVEKENKELKNQQQQIL